MKILKFLLLLFSCGPLFGQLPTFDFKELKNNLYLLQIKSDKGTIGSNMMIFNGSKELMVVDANLPVPDLLGYTEKIIRKKFQNKEISNVTISHWHPDHSGGIGFFAKNARVIAQQNVRNTLSRSQKGSGLSSPGKLQEFPARDELHLPDYSIKNDFAIEFGNETISCIHLPNAHTNGDIIVHFKEANTIHVGDIIWPDSFPFVDYLNGGSATGILEAINYLLENSNDQTIFVPGHGDEFNRKDLENYKKMVSETLDIVKRKIKSGYDSENIKVEGLPAYAKWKTKLVDDHTWIEMIIKTI